MTKTSNITLPARHSLSEKVALLDSGNRVDLSNTLSAILGDLLPDGWSFRAQRMERRAKFDAILDVQPPKGPLVRFAVEMKEDVEPRDVGAFERLNRTLAAGENLLVVAPHFSARSRQLLREHNISYLDPTGSVWLSADTLLVDRIGQGKLPKDNVQRGSRTSLRGPITGRVIRYLCDTRSPLKVRQIAAETSVHPGNVSRILGLLERDCVLERSRQGSVFSVDWESLIKLWSQALQKDRRTESFLEPRDLGAFIGRLPAWNQPYAITGAFASEALAPAAAPMAVDIYVNDIEEARSALSLRRSERVGNVRLIEAFDHVVFERTMALDTNVVLASPSQIAADLLTLPTRSSDEYSALINWMKRNESTWRR